MGKSFGWSNTGNSDVGIYIPLAGSNAITGDLKFTKGSDANFGTNDNFGLNFITNNTTRLAISNDGLITINKSLFFIGTGGASFINIAAQSSAPVAPSATGLNFYSDADGNLSWTKKNGADTFNRTFGGTFSANRMKLLQDTDGTMAELTDIVNTYYFRNGTLLAVAPNTAYYFDSKTAGIAPHTSPTLRRFKFLNDGVIDTMVFNIYQNANGSNQDCMIYLYNQTTNTDYLLLTYQSDFGANTNVSFYADVLSDAIIVNTSDYYSMKLLTGAFTTTPTQYSFEVGLQIKHT